MILTEREAALIADLLKSQISRMKFDIEYAQEARGYEDYVRHLQDLESEYNDILCKLSKE